MDNVLTKDYKEKFIITLLSLLVLFFCSFTVALIALKGGYALFNLGIPSIVENWILVLLSVIFITKILYELVKV
jgi:hypothetical protein